MNYKQLKFNYLLSSSLIPGPYCDEIDTFDEVDSFPKE